MIYYPPDLEKPFVILQAGKKNCRIRGISKVVHTSEGEFGGTDGIWWVEYEELFTQRQKKQLSLIRKTQGKGARQKRYLELRDAIIAEHATIRMVA